MTCSGHGAPLGCDFFRALRRVVVVELLREREFGASDVAVDLLGRGDVRLDTVRVVHGPPVVVLQPVARAEVVHVHDPLADGLPLRVEGLDRDVEVLLGLIAVRARHRSGGH